MSDKKIAILIVLAFLIYVGLLLAVTYGQIRVKRVEINAHGCLPVTQGFNTGVTVFVASGSGSIATQMWHCETLDVVTRY